MIGYLAFLGNQSMEPALEDRTLLLVAAFAFLPGINLLGMMIQNGAALLYPAWVRLGSGRPAGVEALGQNMLMMVVFVALLAVTLLLPVAIGGGGFLLLHGVDQRLGGASCHGTGARHHGVRGRSAGRLARPASSSEPIRRRRGSVRRG